MSSEGCGGAERVGVGAGAGGGGGRVLAAGDRGAAGDQSADGRAAGAERRAAAVPARSGGSQLDRLEPMLRRLLGEWPAIKAPRLTEIVRNEYGYIGSVRLVQEQL